MERIDTNQEQEALVQMAKERVKKAERFLFSYGVFYARRSNLCFENVLWRTFELFSHTLHQRFCNGDLDYLFCYSSGSIVFY